MLVTLTRKEQLSPSIWTFYFSPPTKVRYAAGQYIELDIPHDTVDERGQRRWFTLSSSPTEPELAITTRHATPSSSFKQSLFGLKIGSQLRMSDPMGDFVLPRNRQTPLLFVAGGIGVTPMRSMLKSMIDNHEERDVRMLYAAGSREDLVFSDVIQAAGVDCFNLLQTPSGDSHDLTGRLSSEHITNLVSPADKHLIYLSGPEPMVEQITDDLMAAGYSEHRLVRDYFPGYYSDLSS